MIRPILCLAVLAILIAGCREVFPVRDIHASSAPDISRLMLKSGKVVEFNADLGWYNRHAGTIEGITTDSVHVEYHLTEINKIETVREYSIIPAVYAGMALLGGVIYVIAVLLTHLMFIHTS